MKDAINLIHATEGYPNVKVAKARDNGPDWLTKLVNGNKKMQDAIDQGPGPENRVAVADSWDEKSRICVNISEFYLS